ncbi:MAG: phosphate ABC transporter permease subunit PstC [Desulfotomaculales bacterium]
MRDRVQVFSLRPTPPELRGRRDGPVAPAPRFRPKAGTAGHPAADRLLALATAAGALTIPLVVVLFACELAYRSYPVWMRLGAGFVTGSAWDPVHEEFGALPLVYGTVASSLVALALALPLGLGSAVFLAELAPAWLRNPLSFAVELLAAVPSVVYGLWGLFVLVPWVRTHVQPFLGQWLGWLPLFQGPPLGLGLLAAGMLLAIMITPTIAAIGREVLLSVPLHQREAILALGATRWETIRLVLIPYARPGLIGAVTLALGRALGETMAVTMVIGNRHQIAISLFQPAQTIASALANEFAEAHSALHMSALMAAALLLFLTTLTVNVAARLLLKKIARGPEGMRYEC